MLYKDLDQLASVVKSLTNGECVLDKTGTRFRTYVGQDGNCDAMIKMSGNYDIGLRKSGIGYVPIADFSMIYPNPLMGGHHPMGKVQQEYALREAEYTAAQNGMTATRLTGKNGTVTLELVQAS